MKIRMLAALILACMLIGVLSGCAGNGGTASTAATTAATTAASTAVVTTASTATTKMTAAATTTANTTPVATTTATTAPGASLKMSDIEGMTAPGVLPIVTEPTTLTIGFVPSASVTDFEDNLFTKYVEENTGIDIEFYFFPTGSGEAKQKLQLMVAANQELPDIWSGISLSSAEIYALGRDGYALDLTGYMDKYAYFYPQMLNWASPIDKKNCEVYSKSVDGKMYTMPVSSNDPTDTTANGMYINKTWLDKLGLSIPTSTDELYTVLQAFRDNDPNGNGKKDEIPMLFQLANTGYSREAYKTIVGWFGEYYGDYSMNVQNGTVYYPFVTENYRQSLAYMKKLVQENLFSTLSFTMTLDQYTPILDVSDTGADETVGVFESHPFISFNSSSPTALMDYVYLPTLTANKDTTPYATCYSSFTNFSTMISGKCENPEVAFRLLDYFCDEKTALSARYGEYGTHWKYLTDTDIDPANVYFPNSVFGYKPYWVVYNNPYASNNNFVWRCGTIYFIPTELFGSQVEGSIDNDDVQKYKLQMFSDGCAERTAYLPDEMIANLILTEDEQNTISEIKTSIDQYADECRTAFVSGTMDLDREWDSYIAKLAEMGLQTYIDIAQTAYTRMNG